MDSMIGIPAALSIVLIGLLIYLLGINRQRKQQLKKAMEKQRIQQILFDAYQDSECVIRALENTAGMMTAKDAFLIVLQNGNVRKILEWSQENCYVQNLSQQQRDSALSDVQSGLHKNMSILLYRTKRQSRKYKNDILDLWGLQNLMIVPVWNSNHQLMALLGTADMEKRWNNTAALEGVAQDFMLAMNSTEAYVQVQRRGSMDALTGLKNRNSYQEYLGENSNRRLEAMGCIYIDVNGLHEMNNCLGHSAGDAMLIFVANALNEFFCKDEIYRIGGDEFIVFSKENQAELEEAILKMTQNIETAGYEIAAGFVWKEEVWSLKELIIEAEQKMSQKKHEYYRKKGDIKKVRDMNRKLERILQEKQDADTFLSIISPYFMGVYIVDHDTDEIRSIYQPSYFTTMLEKTKFRYGEALREYIRIFVRIEEQRAFLDFLDYDTINRELDKENTIEYRYTRKDGIRIFIRICQSQNYSREKREVFWIFEKYNG